MSSRTCNKNTRTSEREITPKSHRIFRDLITKTFPGWKKFVSSVFGFPAILGAFFSFVSFFFSFFFWNKLFYRRKRKAVQLREGLCTYSEEDRHTHRRRLLSFPPMNVDCTETLFIVSCPDA
ncbi:hypothetical protein TNCV_3011591 [Trichonephila clavipes]|nr:hypothetical protein TNCV_3011591 [Trichonephila clavipes]